LKAEGNWDLDDPQDMFDLNYFKERPDVFYGFAKVSSRFFVSSLYYLDCVDVTLMRGT